MKHIAIKIVVFILVAVYAAFFYAQKINLTTADLGRHIKNGEVALENFHNLQKNFYSYTEPNFPFVNHHWSSGLIYYFIWQKAGFEGLSYFNILLGVTAFCLMFVLALRKSRLSLAVLSALLVVPLMGYRSEIRPEMFSNLFLAILILIYDLYKDNKIKFRFVLITTLLIQLIWVNTHILFIFGFVPVVLLLLESSLRRDNLWFKHLGLVIATVAVSLVNPVGFKGLLEPFMIFREYGYMVAENQNIFFMLRRFPEESVYQYFLLLVALTVVSILLLALLEKIKIVWREAIIFLVFTVLAAAMVRNLATFGLVLLPILACNCHLLLQKFKEKKGETIINGLAWLMILVIFLAANIGDGNSIWKAKKANAGVGLLAGNKRSADFFKEAGLEGPLFNNYDIGGYLIFNFFPEHKVFVDNRPEAYSVDFFKKIYIPAQENEQVWQKILQEYNFQIIYFYWHDATPWAQPFLIRRINDPAWAAIYVDDYALILARNGGVNKDIIQRFQLPKEIFSVK